MSDVRPMFGLRVRTSDESGHLLRDSSEFALATMVHEPSRVTLPREIIPGRFYMITRRCTQRMFLLRPDAKTNEAFWYCVAVAAVRTEMEVILPSAMSNHHHTIVYDRHGTVVDFTRVLHELLAKCMNARWRRRENFWSAEQSGLLQLIDRNDVLEKLVYAATNPVKDNLVETVREWPGANGLSALLEQRPVTARRPSFYFRADGTMPASIALELVIPPELGERDEILEELRTRVAAAEDDFAAKRRRKGKRVLGRRRVLAQDPFGSPKQPTKFQRTLNPKFAARNKWSLLEAVRRNADFISAYRKARRAMLTGNPIPFPFGTFWLRRHARVAIVEPQLA